MENKLYEKAHIVFEEISESLYKMTKNRMSDVDNKEYSLNEMMNFYNSDKRVLIIFSDGNECRNFNEMNLELTDEVVEYNAKLHYKIACELLIDNALNITEKSIDNELRNLQNEILKGNFEGVELIKQKLISLHNQLLVIKNKFNDSHVLYKKIQKNGGIEL